MIVVLFHHTEVQKAISFLQEPLLKTHVNSKYQSKGQIYNLQLLSFEVIRLFKVFLWERKTGFGKKTVRDAGFSRKRSGDAGLGPPFQTLLLTWENEMWKKANFPRTESQQWTVVSSFLGLISTVW